MPQKWSDFLFGKKALDAAAKQGSTVGPIVPKAPTTPVVPAYDMAKQIAEHMKAVSPAKVSVPAQKVLSTPAPKPKKNMR